MNEPTTSSIVRSSIAVACVAVVLALSGCAGSDVITYSRDAQRKGIDLYNDGSYAEAAGAFRNAARQNPRSYKSYYYMGACYEQLGQFQKAVHAYRTARGTLATSLAGKEDTEFRIRILNGLGRAMARSDQRDIETDAAVAEAEQQSNGENWFVVAKIYAFRGDADSAVDAFNRACLLSPQNPVYCRDYGLYLEQIGQPTKAQAPLRRAYTLDPDDAEVNLALRRVGVVPGPSLKNRSALVKPALPKGPIPELDLQFGGGTHGVSSSTVTATAPPAAQQPTVQAPRD